MKPYNKNKNMAKTNGSSREGNRPEVIISGFQSQQTNKTTRCDGSNHRRGLIAAMECTMNARKGRQSMGPILTGTRKVRRYQRYWSGCRLRCTPDSCDSTGNGTRTLRCHPLKSAVATWTNGSMNRCTDGRINGSMRTDGWMDGLVEQCMTTWPRYGADTSKPKEGRQRNNRGRLSRSFQEALFCC